MSLSAAAVSPRLARVTRVRSSWLSDSMLLNGTPSRPWCNNETHYGRLAFTTFRARRDDFRKDRSAGS
jgi:hypothetical protein